MSDDNLQNYDVASAALLSRAKNRCRAIFSKEKRTDNNSAVTMTVIQIRCDRCGEIIETGRHKLTLQCEPRPESSSRDSATSDPAIDLCKPCFDDLHQWFAES
jgi:hypothetical protein